MTQPEPPKDDKDWTWTLVQVCPDCGYDPAAVAPEDVAALVTAYTRPWAQVEYACHVRDVCAVFAVRATLMLAQDEPHFPNWDQDETAITDRYADQDPAVVADELARAAGDWSAVYAACSGPDWERTGIRSNGSQFTVASLGVYGLHDIRHHLWDVGAIPV